jgi:hypothetical protein
MSHKIELLPSQVSGARDTMWRCGRKFEVNIPQVLDLTKDELEAFKNDWRFKVSDSNDPSEKVAGGATAKSETIPPADSASPKEKFADKVKAAKDRIVAQKEIVDNQDKELPDIDELLKTYSRDELDLQASELGIENPQQFNNKTEVAQAIIDVR